MKKLLPFSFTLCFVASFLCAQQYPAIEWAKSIGRNNPGTDNSITVDAAGNVYTTGFFRGTVDFDPGPGTFNLTSNGGDDIFISKLDASGIFVWAKSIGGAGGDRGHSLALEASGNIYTTGYFNGPVDFDPGPGIFNLMASGDTDIFISKLDASGNFVWAKSMDGAGGDRGHSLALDASGNIYTTGYFNGPVDFDPGPGTFVLIPTGGDVFVSKLNAAGNFIWAKNMGGVNGDVSNSIAVDAAGNAYITGYFQGTADFDPGPGSFNLTASGASEIFISKLDAAGNFVWATSMGGSSSTILRDDGHSIAVDSSGNVYTTGWFQGTADFDPGPGIFNLTSPGGDDGYISKLDASGNFIWAKQINKMWTTTISIAVDATGNVYTTGRTVGNPPTDFDPSPAVFNIAGTTFLPMYISKLDALGAFVWAIAIPATNGTTFGTSIAVDATGNVYTTGHFIGTPDFDPGSGIYNLTSVNGDMFILKLTQLPCPSLSATASVSGATVTLAVSAGAAPYNYTLGGITNNTGVFIGVGNGSYTYMIRDAFGCAVTGTVTVTGGNSCPPDTTITLSSCSASANVVWSEPGTSFPTTISIPSGFYPDGRPFPGGGRLTLLGTFGGHYYYRSSDALQSYRWEVANSIATSVGGHLTIITSEAENAFILSRVQSTGYFSWLGLRRTGTGPTQFSWVTGEPLGYTNWGPEDPNNGGSNTTIAEPYVFMYEGSGKWHDLVDFLLPFQVEYDQAPIRWRQISGPANGSSLGQGVYPVCYERFNATTNKKDTCCFTVTVQCNASTITVAALDKQTSERAVDFSVKTLPNPSSTSFTLQLNSQSKERISVRVMDISGRLIEARDGVASNAVLQLGSQYRPGTYVVHLQQGTKRTTLKLVKQAR